MSIPLQTTISFVSFDPGGSDKPSTGMATWTSTGEHIASVKLTNKQLTQMLIDLEPVAGDIQAFIIEAYTGRPGFSTGGNKFKTSQQIGALKYYCDRWGIEKVLQGSYAKDMGMAYSQIKRTWKGKHMPDDISAYCHGYYYLHNKGLLRPKVLDDPELRIK